MGAGHLKTTPLGPGPERDCRRTGDQDSTQGLLRVGTVITLEITGAAMQATE